MAVYPCFECLGGSWPLYIGGFGLLQSVFFSYPVTFLGHTQWHYFVLLWEDRQSWGRRIFNYWDCKTSLQPVDMTAVLHSGRAFHLQFKQAEATAQTQATTHVTSWAWWTRLWGTSGWEQIAMEEQYSQAHGEQEGKAGKKKYYEWKKKNH